jgi:predicted RNA-binding Zn ribbon-like protein
MADDGEWCDGFRFAGGHPALDLTATVKGRLKASPTDRLATPVDLERWLAVAGLASTTATEGDLAAARDLREAIYALALARASGAQLNAGARERLNASASGTTAAAVLQVDGSARLHGDASALLGHVARRAVALLAGQEGGVIRQCAGDGCAILFLDQSRAGGRRWCSMSVCGNRAKAAAFRRRDRET